VSGLLLRGVEVEGAHVDVRIVGPTIAAVAAGLRPDRDTEVVDGHGGALIPGLHDHHLHLLATAADRRSVRVDPASISDRSGFERTLAAADAALPPGRWLRATGYHESVAGDLDREALDSVVPNRPVRLQHRSGARWVLNSAAVAALHLDDAPRPGVERDPAGRPTGRLHRVDAWLRSLLPAEEPPDLAALGASLARYGVTGVTDATPSSDLSAMRLLAAAAVGGALPQRVVVTGGPALAAADLPPGLERGPVKLIVDDADYPDLDDLAGQMAAAHDEGRAVAVHCVTRTALVLALAAWDIAGSRPGDRVEHGSVVPPELRAPLRRHGLTVVTQPGFVGERGDAYLADVDPSDLPHLYPCRSLLDDGIPVGGSTDAPYTDTDPWRAMRAAVSRATPSGRMLGPWEAVPARRALELFLGDAPDPGGPPRRVVAGARADLCLLSAPLGDVLADLSADHVACVVAAGRIVHR
jgi:predicted amidohydrolase YtcJ